MKTLFTIALLFCLSSCEILEELSRMRITYFKGEKVWISDSRQATVVARPDKCGNYVVETDSGWRFEVNKIILDQYNE